jgi:sulfotransferase family protein
MSDSVGRLPDFIIVGGMKCGTTSLYEYLLRHPAIFMSANKEPDFFSDSEVFEKGENWYRALFQDAEPNQVCGEASTSYTRNREYRIGSNGKDWVDYSAAPQRMREMIPDVKLIYIVRNPVERAYSHYSFNMQYDSIIPFADAASRDNSIIETGMYTNHINRYLEQFPANQLLVVLADDLKRDPSKVLSQVQSFLEVPERDLVAGAAVTSNKSGSVYAFRSIKENLESLRRIKSLRRMILLLPLRYRQAIIRKVSQWLANSSLGTKLSSKHKAAISELTSELRSELLKTYEQSTTDLENFLGRSLASWRQ